MRLSIYWTYDTDGGTLTAMTKSHTAYRHITVTALSVPRHRPPPPDNPTW